jgi:hypothetical protein
LRSTVCYTRTVTQAENGEAAADDGSGGGSEVKKGKKRGFVRSDSFKAAFGPTMVSDAATLHKRQKVPRVCLHLTP